MYSITDQHMLEGDGVTFTRAADYGGLIVPELVVVHFTAGGLAERSVAWLTKKDENYVSAHIVIGRRGEVFQLVPFDRAAYHAGRSTWKGRSGCNGFSVGIELANYGPLERVGDLFYSWSGQQVSPADVHVRDHSPEAIPHKNGGPPKYWEGFPDAQVGRCAEIVSVLLRKYPAIPKGCMGCSAEKIGIVGHDDIAPGRKTDPGPAWNWAAFDIALQAARGNV